MEKSNAWEDHKHGIRLHVPEEFSYTENLQYLSRTSNECLFHIKEQKIYRAIPIGNSISILEISAEPSNALMLRFIGNTMPTNPLERAAIAAYMRDWFDLDTDLRPFYELAKTDSLLERAIQKFYGLRVIGIPDFFEAICWGIIGQQINLAFAYTLKRRFVESYGRSVKCEGIQYWLFPTPRDIATLRVDDLRALKMTEKKSEYLIHVAQLIVEGKLTKEMLQNAGDHRKAEKMLTNIRGIGPWTAHYVLMRCLRYPAAFPIDDVGLHNAIKHVLNMDRKPTKEELLKLSSTWTNWESYATFYLWRYLY